MVEFVYVDRIHVVPNTTIDGARSHYLCLSPSRGGEVGASPQVAEVQGDYITVESLQAL